MNNELKDMLQSVLKEELAPIKEDIQSLKSGQAELNQLIHAMRNHQEETSAKLDALIEDVNYIKGDVTALTDGQTRQEKILETLALRSIEQESELREVKRAK